MSKNQPTCAEKKGHFACFAQKLASWSGHPAAFIGAALIIIVWAVTGPLVGFSDTWQLIINTLTTLVTFLMVFLIQNTQNRDLQALQLKLDELIRATEGAHTVLLDLEELSDKQLQNLHQKYEDIAEAARERLKKGLTDTDIPEVDTDMSQAVTQR